MSNTANIFDVVDDDALFRAIDEGRADVAAGRTVPHEIVREWLKNLANGEFDAPPPLSTTIKPRSA
jgi:predicted transcriptional regulator